MKQQITWIAAAGLCLCVATPTFAQATNATGAAGHKLARSLAELKFEKMDANGDGKVTVDEYLAAWTDLLKRRFAAMDTNGDGVLTKDEVEKAREAHRPGGKHGGETVSVPAAASTTGAVQK